MRNQTLSVEQMMHLKELGVDTSKASMCWLHLNLLDEEWVLAVNDRHASGADVELIPAFTLQDIIEVLPKEIKTSTDTYWLTMSHDSEEWYICYSMSDEFDYYKEFKSDSLLEAAYNMLCWCAENGYLETDKEE